MIAASLIVCSGIALLLPATNPFDPEFEEAIRRLLFFGTLGPGFLILILAGAGRLAHGKLAIGLGICGLMLGLGLFVVLFVWNIGAGITTSFAVFTLLGMLEVAGFLSAAVCALRKG
jgi:hypothetical protein